jgi:hypothetical protein
MNATPRPPTTNSPAFAPPIGIGRPVDPNQVFRPGDGLLGQLHDIGARRQRIEIASIGPQRGRDDLPCVGSFGVEYVVTPVGVEDGTMTVAVVPIRRFPVGGVEHREEIRKEIDQHARGYENPRGDARES